MEPHKEKFLKICDICKKFPEVPACARACASVCEITYCSLSEGKVRERFGMFFFVDE